jgi:transcription initiation factor TFIIIB Brf1 subunit/transcription initiation factor TFIIB
MQQRKRKTDEELDWRQAFKYAHATENGTAPDSDADKWCVSCGASEEWAREDGNNFAVSCGQCGTVMETFSDDRPEWSSRNETRMYGSDPTRGEAINPLMPHASMSTDIGSAGGRLPYRQYKMVKLNRWQTYSSVERSLCVVFTKLEQACGRHKVPSSVQYTAKWLFKRVYECNIEVQKQGRKREGLRGPKRDGLITACLYYAFKANDLYWTKTDCAAVMDIDVAELRRGKSIFWSLLKDNPLPDALTKITGCKQYIACFAVQLGLSPQITNFAKKLYRELHRKGLGASKQPQSVAAGCLFSVCSVLRPDIKLATIADVTNISKGTIKDVVRVSREVGAEPLGLLAVFVREICDLCNVHNPLTRSKAKRVTAHLFRIGLHTSPYSFSLWELSAFALYFVLVRHGIPFNEKNFQKKCSIGDQVLLRLAKAIVPYRDDIAEHCNCQCKPPLSPPDSFSFPTTSSATFSDGDGWAPLIGGF